MFDWDAFLSRLRRYPPGLHSLWPPCPAEQIEAVERELGGLPTTIWEMLRRFNGAELFCIMGAAFTFFRVSTVPPLPPSEWASDWCIDIFTREWRKAGANRERDWAIGMNNYGGLVLLDANGNIKEWDTGETRWLLKNVPFDEWIDKLMDEGEEIMAELGV